MSNAVSRFKQFLFFFGILFLVYIYYKLPCYVFILPD